MRSLHLLLASAAAIAGTSAQAADELKFGKAPGWVVAQPIPASPAGSADAPVAVLLADQQVQLQPGRVATYTELAMKIQKPEGLSAGNVSIPWDPATDTVTVNKLEIHRGAQVIDVLAGGQKFTTMRRESGLEAAMIDGNLTANIQPEGLQEGDVLDLAMTVERVDPIMNGHVESNFAAGTGIEVRRSHLKVEWPASLKLNVQGKGLAIQPVTRETTKVVEVTTENLEPIIPPKGAPARFSITRFGEATDFASWADVAKLMDPLFRKAEIIPSTGPLHDEVEKIRAASNDPTKRAEAALQLVQDRVRYVALLMGQGSYVPASAEETWSRRFGDCKAKTALLLGILHSLNIEAEPLLVQSKIGDAIAERLPLLSYFDHVLVRAHIDGKPYYLDGTRTGDTHLPDIEVPYFGWGLPVVNDAKLVALVPPARTIPNHERRVEVDASAGIYAPSPITVIETYRGDSAIQLNAIYAALSTAQRDEVYRKNANEYFDGFQVTSSSIQFDKAKREFGITIKGNAKLNWRDSWFYVPTSSIAFTPDYARPPGPDHDAPIDVAYPSFAKDTATLKLPGGFAARQKLDAPVHETLAGVEYSRAETVNGDTLTVVSSERSVIPEVPYKDALAAAARLKALSQDDVYLKLLDSYRVTAADVQALGTQSLTSAAEYVHRGTTYLQSWKFDEAIADFTQALSSDPKNIWALANRGLAYVWKHDDVKATADLSAAAAIDPNNPVMLSARGLQSEIKHNWVQAAEFYSKALEANPANTFALFRRADVLFAQGKSEEAIKDLNAATAQDPTDPNTLTARAEIEASLGRLDEARRDIAAAKAIKPDTAGILSAEAAVAKQTDDMKELVSVATRMIALRPQEGQGYQERAQARYELGQFKDALSDTDQALKLGLKSTELRVLRANIFTLTGHDDAVLMEAQAMVREQPGSDYAWVAAAKSYTSLGRRDDAFKAYEKALSIKPLGYIYVNRAQSRPITDDAGRTADYDAALTFDPNDPDALTGKADILARHGKFSDAADIYAKAIQIAPDRKYLAIQRAALVYRAGRTAEAEKIFSDARRKGDDASTLNSLCWAKATAGILLESAHQDCLAALQLKPGNSSYLDSLGMVLLKLGKFDQALAAYNQALTTKPGSASLMGRAFVYAKLGDKAHSEADAAAARKITPEIEQIFATDYGLKF